MKVPPFPFVPIFFFCVVENGGNEAFPLLIAFWGPPRSR